MEGKRIYEDIENRVIIKEGWSEDKKYCVTAKDGTQYLLRISPITQYKEKELLFSLMKMIAELDVPMCLPVEFGLCKEGVYSLHSWIKGVDLQKVLPLSGETLLSEEEQYKLGWQSGKIIGKIHGISVGENQEKWDMRFNREIDAKVKEYQQCGLNFKGDKRVLAYIRENRHLLQNRPQCYCLSDFNVINMMIENNELRIIDFERFDIGDPWNEFNSIFWSAMASPLFATGQLRGYFDGEPSKLFFKLLSLYNFVLLISLFSSWAVHSEYGREVCLKLSQKMLDWFDYMKEPVPQWYRKDYLPKL